MDKRKEEKRRVYRMESKLGNYALIGSENRELGDY